MKLAVSMLSEKANEMLADVEARISEVEILMQEYDPFTEAKLAMLDLESAIDAKDTTEIKKIGRLFYYFKEEDSELKGRLRELAGTYRRIKRVATALRLTTDQEVSYNPNRRGQNAESATYAELLDFKGDAPSERELWEKATKNDDDEDDF